MITEHNPPISLKIWFAHGGVSRNVDGVTHMEMSNGIMRVQYRDRDNTRKTLLVSMTNINMIEEM